MLWAQWEVLDNAAKLHTPHRCIFEDFALIGWRTPQVPQLTSTASSFVILIFFSLSLVNLGGVQRLLNQNRHHWTPPNSFDSTMDRSRTVAYEQSNSFPFWTGADTVAMRTGPWMWLVAGTLRWTEWEQRIWSGHGCRDGKKSKVQLLMLDLKKKKKALCSFWLKVNVWFCSVTTGRHCVSSAAEKY